MRMEYGRVSRKGEWELKSPGVKRTERIGNGRYIVEFKEGVFSEAPAITATVISKKRGCGRGPTTRFISVTSTTNERACLGIAKKGSGGSKKRAFSFIAIGD